MVRSLCGVCALVLVTGPAAAAAAPDLAALDAALDAVEPIYDEAVAAAGLVLDLDRTRLSLAEGTLIPIGRPGEGPTLEWIFVGAGRLTVTPPAGVEADSLAYFTGARAVDTVVRSAIVIPGDAWVGDPPAGRASTPAADDVRAAAAALFGEWVKDAEREGFGARRALLRALAGDPPGLRFAGAWMDAPALGRVFAVLDPSSVEPNGFGAYRLYALREFLTKRQRTIEDRWQRRRLRFASPTRDDTAGDDPPCGERDDDEDDLDGIDDRRPWVRPWMLAPPTDAGNRPGPPGFEPEHYTIRLELTGDDLRAEGETRIRLAAEVDGLTVVPLALGQGMDICAVEDEAGRSLAFVERGGETLVALAEPATAGTTFELTTHVAGRPVRRRQGRRALRRTVAWHPHVGRIDRATYDVTLSWPAGLTLLASGTPVDGGAEDAATGSGPGRRWTRQRLDVPAIGFSFEIDDYDVVSDEIGHVDLVFGFHRRDDEMTPERRAEIVRAVKATLLYYEGRLGLLPIDRLTVVATDRGFSQGLLGFLTLTEGMLHARPFQAVDNRGGQEVRLSLIAHEMAHQWWGNAMGWAGYRDQWLSEALATFSATEFMTTIARDPDDHRRRAAERLRRSLRLETMGGRPIGSIGSVTLGRRLIANFGSFAYHVVVYDKGAVIFDTLAERLGREPTWKMLGALAQAVNNRVIATDTFFLAFERMSGQDLDAFVDQYVRDPGVPVVIYEYEPRRQEDGTWVVAGVAHQFPAERFRYAVVAGERGWDVVRRFDRGPEVTTWRTALPFVVDTSVPGRPSGIAGTVTVDGPRTAFEIPVEAQPGWLALDPDDLALAEARGGAAGAPPTLYHLGEHLLRLGRHDEAAETLARALAAAGEDDEGHRAIAVRTRLALARLHLDRGDVKAARRELRAVEETLPRDADFYLGERTLLDARLDILTGQYERAADNLNRFFERFALELELGSPDAMLDPPQSTALRFARGEATALLAVAENARRNPDVGALIRRAELAGVDMGALGGR